MIKIETDTKKHLTITRNGERRAMNEMTSKEVVNLIDWLKKQGMTAEQILECIEYIEKHEPEKN